MTGTMQANDTTFAALTLAKQNAHGVADWLKAETAYQKWMATLPAYEQMNLLKAKAA